MSLRTLAVATLMSATLMSATLLTAASPAIAGVSSDERKAIERIIHDYLVNNPEVLLEAMQALEKRQQMASNEKARASINKYRDQIFNDASSPVGGNLKGNVTVVEFFDYNCGYCKAVHDDALKLVRDDANIRYVYKEYPILSPASTTAAKAALAARVQGKYAEAHNALMSHRGRLDDSVIMRLMGDVGLDLTKLKADMESSPVKQALESNQTLGAKLEINGTPAFIIGDELAPGAIKLDEMKRMVAEARKK